MYFVWYFVLLTEICCLDTENSFGLVKSYLKRSNEKVKLHKVLLKEGLDLKIAFAPLREDTVAKINDENYETVNYILDLSCPKADIVVKESSDCGKFKFAHKWLMIANDQMNRNNIKKIFKNVSLRMDTNIKLAVPGKDKSKYFVYEIYYPGVESEVKVNEIGIYTNGNLVYFDKDESFYNKRKNMSGILIRTGNLVDYNFTSPENYTKALRNRHIDTFGKFHFQIFLYLEHIHHFHFNTTVRTEWFGNSSPGMEAGIAKLLWEKKADINSGGGILRATRMIYWDFLVPYYRFRTSFFFKNPGKVNPGGEVLKPFSTFTWYCFLGAMVAVSLAIKAAYWIENRYLTTRINYSIFTSFVVTISLIAQQGSSLVPNHVGGRIIFLSILILSILLYNYYTSALVSSLLNTKPNLLKTLKELYESNLKVGSEYRPYTNTYIIQTKDDEWVQKMNDSRIFTSGHPNYYSPEEGLAKVKKGGFAYHTEATTAYTVISRTYEPDPICDLTQVEFIGHTFAGFVAPKKSQYRQLFLVSLMKMYQSGIFKRERDVWVVQEPQCQLSLRVLSVGVNELFLVYMILVGGIFLATTVFCIEKFWYKMQIGVKIVEDK